MNPDSDSEGKQTVIPTQNRQQSERSDAGALIISEVDAFGQLGTASSSKFDSSSESPFFRKRGAPAPHNWDGAEARDMSMTRDSAPRSGLRSLTGSAAKAFPDRVMPLF